MKPEKKKRLERKGWKVASAEDFLGLTPQEAPLVDLRLKLADAVKLLRKDKHLTQTQLAKLLGSSQSRVAKVEAAAASVSLDLLIRSYFAMGATTDDLGKVIGAMPRPTGAPAEDFWDRPHYNLHSPCAERMTENSADTPIATSVQAQKKAPFGAGRPP